jgi:broad specificity phosphatase PhoE
VATIYLVRHGRTELNRAGALRGRIDVPLDEVGTAEAARLAELFASVALTAVITSPLARARATGVPIAGSTGAPLDVDERLLDRDYGQWAGCLQADVETHYGSLDSAPGVEAWTTLVARASDALASAAARAKHAPVLVVAHDAVNRALLATLAGADGENGQLVTQRTGCWNRLDWGPDGWRVLVLDAVPGDGQVP